MLQSPSDANVAVIEIPRMYFVKVTEGGKVGKNLVAMDIEWEALRDPSCTLPGSPTQAQTDAGYSALRVAVGQ